MAKKSKHILPKKRLLLMLAAISLSLILIFSKNREAGVLIERTKFQVREAVEPIIKPPPTIPPSPTTKVLTGGYHTFQTFNNCGPASLSMALRYFGINVSQHDLGDQ